MPPDYHPNYYQCVRKCSDIVIKQLKYQLKFNKNTIQIQKRSQKIQRQKMTQNNQIFINQQVGNSIDENQSIQYVQDTQSDQFINQFLYNQSKGQIYEQQHQSAPQIFINNAKQIQQQNCKKKKRQKSLFHNFQKHLVITLKRMIRIICRPQDGIVGQVAQQMWEIFLNSHIYTKTILHILYGAQQQQQQCSFTSSMLNKYGYVDLFNKYSDTLVKQAQQYLRKQTLKTLKRVNVKQYLLKRRLSKSLQFQDYLNEFIQQLSEGPIKKRIPKHKKKKFSIFQKTSLEKI